MAACRSFVAWVFSLTSFCDARRSPALGSTERNVAANSFDAAPLNAGACGASAPVVSSGGDASWLTVSAWLSTVERSEELDDESSAMASARTELSMAVSRFVVLCS